MWGLGKGAGEGQGKADIYAGRETKGQSARGVRGGGKRKTVKERERETAQANGGGRGWKRGRQSGREDG